MKARVPAVLTIAGSDSGGGAGIQADLKTFAALGVYGTSAVTAITAQNTQRVVEVFELPASVVAAQIDAIVDDIRIHAVKTGMLANAEIIEAVADATRRHELQPLVVDPVMVATSGARLLEDAAVEALVTRLIPLATVVTPNHHEAEALTGQAGSKRAFAERLHAMGAAAVIVTGGHGDEAVDWLYDGDRHVEIPVDRIPAAATHGAGCTHSATLAALLARGFSLEDAARGAAEAARASVEHGLTEIGAGEGPVDVFHLSAHEAV